MSTSFKDAISVSCHTQLTDQLSLSIYLDAALSTSQVYQVELGEAKDTELTLS